MTKRYKVSNDFCCSKWLFVHQEANTMDFINQPSSKFNTLTALKHVNGSIKTKNIHLYDNHMFYNVLSRAPKHSQLQKNFLKFRRYIPLHLIDLQKRVRSQLGSIFANLFRNLNFLKKAPGVINYNSLTPQVLTTFWHLHTFP